MFSVEDRKAHPDDRDTTLFHYVTPERREHHALEKGYNLQRDDSMQSYKLNKAAIWIPLSFHRVLTSL